MTLEWTPDPPLTSQAAGAAASGEGPAAVLAATAILHHAAPVDRCSPGSRLVVVRM